MTRPRPELAEVVRKHADKYLATYAATTAQRRVLRAVQNCRTAALGGHVEACDHCDHRRIAYNSCRNRHCPKCQGSACARWMQARAEELLPVPYFHLVFTLPTALSPLALQNPRLLYGLLFQAASQTLLEVAANPRHLGAEIGFLAVLHTWARTCCTIPTCIAWFLRAAFPPRGPTGFVVAGISSCPFASSAGYFAVNSWPG